MDGLTSELDPRDGMNASWLVVAACASACGGTGADDEDIRFDLVPFTHLVGREAYGTVRSRVAAPVAPGSRAEVDARTAVLRPFLQAASRLPAMRVPPAASLLVTQQVDGVRVEHLLLDGFAGMHIPATLYLPASATPLQRVPAMVVNVGHDADGQRASYVRRLAWSLARGGVAALTIDWLGMGSRFSDEQRHVPVGLRSILAGLLPEEALLGEPLAAWDYLVSRPEIDGSRVGMVGQSGGGMTTMHLAAIEPRVALAVVVDIVVTNTFMVDARVGWGDPDSIPPGELAETSHGEILGLIAPRPLFVMSGDEDYGIAPTAVSAQALEVTRAWYAIAGGTVEHRGFPTAHEFSSGKIDRALTFVGTHLLGAPITRAADPPDWTAPLAGVSPGDPLWLDLVGERWATPPDGLATADAASAWVADTRAALKDVLGPSRRVLVRAPSPAATITLWVSDVPLIDGGEMSSALVALGSPVVRFSPLGLDALARDEVERRFLGQNAIGVGTSVLRLAVDDLQGVVHALRAGGATRIVAACEGEQATLMCAALAVSDDPPDGLALAGVPASFPDRFPLEATEPTLGYLTLGLGGVVSPELLIAASAPRPVALVGSPPWTFLPALYELLAADAVLDAESLPAAVAHVLLALGPE